MAKFADRSIGPFFTEARNAARVSRKAEFIVAVECDDGSWCELDAESIEHAGMLAHNWVDVLGARGASCWRASVRNGKCARTPFYTHYENACFDD